MFTMLPTTAFAAWAVPTLKVEAVRDGDQIKTTVKIGPHTDMGAINFTLNYDSSKLTLSGSPAGQNFLSGAIIGSVTPGKITPTWHDINATSSATEIPILTATFDIVAGQSGPAVFTIDSISITDKSGDEENTSPGAGSVTTTTVTIPKAPIASVTASVDAPVKGEELDTTVDIGGATGYTAAVEWYEGTNDSGAKLPNPTTAKPSQFYFAKITLTAKSGETFAESLDNTISGDYSVTRVSDTVLTLTKAYPETARAEVTKVQIASTPPSLNVPEAAGIGVPGTVTVPNTYSVTVFMDGSPVVNPPRRCVEHQRP